MWVNEHVWLLRFIKIDGSKSLISVKLRISLAGWQSSDLEDPELEYQVKTCRKASVHQGISTLKDGVQNSRHARSSPKTG